MNSSWNLKKSDNFGWYLEGQSEIKAFWMPDVEFSNPESIVSGKISESSLKNLQVELLKHTSEITLWQNLISALQTNVLTAFKVSNETDSGFMIVLTDGGNNFQTIARKKDDQTLAYGNNFNPDSYYNEYNGVKGWLFFFCISLTVLTPIFFLIGVFISIAALHELGNRYAGYKAIVFITIFIDLIMTILAVKVGISLFNVKANAVQDAKKFMVLSLVTGLIQSALPFLVKLPYTEDKAKGITFVIGVFQTFVYFAIWYSYLNTSKRVKATYSLTMTEDEYFKRGNEYLELAYFTNAVDDFSEAIRINPLNSKAYNNRGNAYFGLGNYLQAIEDYTKAIELDRNFARAYNNRGFAYEKIENFTEAIKDYKEASRLLPEFAGFYENAAHSYLRTGDLANSIINYEKCIELDPKKFTAMLGIAEAYFKLGDTAKGKKYFDDAIAAEQKVSEGLPGIEKLEMDGWNFTSEDKRELKKLFELFGK